jgi:hypothetical protein
VTTERNGILAARVAPFADKHQIWVGFHITRTTCRRWTSSTPSQPAKTGAA